MRFPTTLLLLAIGGYAAVQVVRGPSAPKSGELANPAPRVDRYQDIIQDEARADSLRSAREDELRRVIAVPTPTATFQPENRLAQPTPPTPTKEEEEMAHCSAVPIYGPEGYIVGWSANPDCAAYRASRHEPRGPAAIREPFSSPIPR